ncbi:MAG: chorismate mutase [Streptomyces sp.]|nr:chorismate mutase [Streptomyces sp.]
MRSRCLSRYALAMAAGFLLTTGTTPAGAATAKPVLPAGSVAFSSDSALTHLVQWYAVRLTTADKVAAAKWGTAQPIDDPVREQQVLKSVAAKAKALGIHQDVARRIFVDQIEANKVVQRGIYRDWARHPSRIPRRRPDLAKDVRPELDRVDAALLRAVRAAQPQLAATRCATRTARAAGGVAESRNLDALHRQGLERALAHTCSPSDGHR